MNELRTTLRDDLIAAKALIDTPEKWIKGNWQDADGCRFCALGAAIAVCRKGSWLPVQDALEQSLPSGFYAPEFARAVATYNDLASTSHADIMALFDRAISKASVQS